jgi:hypothetical protein
MSCFALWTIVARVGRRGKAQGNGVKMARQKQRRNTGVLRSAQDDDVRTNSGKGNSNGNSNGKSNSNSNSKSNSNGKSNSNSRSPSRMTARMASARATTAATARAKVISLPLIYS